MSTRNKDTGPSLQSLQIDPQLSLVPVPTAKIETQKDSSGKKHQIQVTGMVQPQTLPSMQNVKIANSMAFTQR
jgi:hypothetical protein